MPYMPKKVADDLKSNGKWEESRTGTAPLCVAAFSCSYETIVTENGSLRKLSLTCRTPATFSAATIAALR